MTHPRIARCREAVRQTDDLVAEMVHASEEERRRWAAEARPSRRSPMALWIASALIITAWAVVMAILLAR